MEGMGDWEVPLFLVVESWEGATPGLPPRLVGGWWRWVPSVPGLPRKSELPGAKASCGRQGYLFFCP